MEIAKKNKFTTCLEKWSALPFQKDLFQIILSIIYFSLMVTCILLRDALYININKYIFVGLSALFLIFLRKEYIIYSFVFLIPFSMGLPSNWIVLVFFVFIVIKNRFRFNLAQVIFPCLFGLIELLLVFKCDGFSNGMGDYFACFEYFSFLLFSCYLLLDRHLVINKKKISIYLITGIVLMCSFTLLIQTKMMAQLAAFKPEYSLLNLMLDPYVRLENVSMFNGTSPDTGWISMMAGQVIIVFPDVNMTIGDDPNNMAFYLIVATAFLLYITTRKKSSYIPTLIVLVLIGVLGLYTKSRTFLIAFPILLIVWYVIALISRRFSLKSLIWVLSVFALCILTLVIINCFVDIFSSIFGRFIGIGNSDAETGRFALIVAYLQSMFSNWFTALFGSGVICMQTVLNQDLSSHTAIIQIFVSYGIIGTLLFASLCTYIIYVRCYGRFKLIDLNSFIPLFAVCVFTLALQVLNPFFIMVICSISVMAINNYSTIKQKPFKFNLLTNLIYLKHPEKDVVIDYSGDKDNFVPLSNYIKPHKKPHVKKEKVVIEEKTVVQPVVAKPKPVKVKKEHIKETPQASSSFSFDDYFCDDNVAITYPNDQKEKWYDKISKYIRDLYDSFNLNKLVKAIKSSSAQIIILAVTITLLELYVCFVTFFSFDNAKIYLLLLLAVCILLMNKKTIILTFAFSISLTNFLPQRYFILFLFVSYVIKSHFKINVAQIAFAMTFIFFELLDGFIFGFTDYKESLSFLMIVSFLIYVCLDKTFKVNVKSLALAYIVGFVFAVAMLMYPSFYYCNYAISHSTTGSNVSFIEIIVNNKFRLGDYKTLFWYLNETFECSLTLSMIPNLIDNPNNIAYFALFAFVASCILLKKKALPIILVSLSLLLCVGVGFLTKSRFFFVALLIAILLYYVFAIIKKKIHPLVSMFIFVGMMLIVIIYCLCDPTFSFIKYYINRPDVTGSDASGRFDIIASYLEFMFTNIKYLFTGTGLLNTMALTGIDISPHMNVLQVFVAYGLLGTVTILFGFGYTIYVRLYKQKINLFRFVPLIAIIVLTLSLQVLTPYELMYPFVLAVLFINNGDYIQEKGKKIKGLFYLLPFNKYN